MNFTDSCFGIVFLAYCIVVAFVVFVVVLVVVFSFVLLYLFLHSFVENIKFMGKKKLHHPLQLHLLCVFV